MTLKTGRNPGLKSETWGTRRLKKALAVLAANDADVAKASFTLNDLQGNEVRLSELRGKIVLVTFWATWCGPCLREMPTLDAIYKRFQPQGLAVLWLTSEQRSKVEPFMKRQDYRPLVLLDTGGKVSKQFHVGEIPHSFVFDRKGKFVADSIGSTNENQFLAMLAKAGLGL
ncbi:MAG TPA: TlpA disulfide reductase family protein [Acidobacteriaceae bacterium]|nr:TlpA disulfide reductase family protein [Acidobacteriaceae bacterium]